MKTMFPLLFPSNFIIVILASLALALPQMCWSQKKQLVTTGPVVKIAYVDHSALRKGFIGYKDSIAFLTKTNNGANEALSRSLQLLDQQTKDLLIKDSLTGSNGKQQILNNSASKRAALTATFQAGQKNRNDARVVMMGNFERKIILAIDAVVNEGGFTDVKPLTKDATAPNGKNITSLVLSKLNK